MKETDKRLELLEQRNIKTMDKLDELTEGQNEIKVTLAGLPELLAEKFDERYASKKYEQSLDKLNWMVISAVVLALLGLIIKIV